MKRPVSPCYRNSKGCPDRTPTCRKTCEKFKEYEKAYRAFESWRTSEYQSADHKTHSRSRS